MSIEKEEKGIKRSIRKKKVRTKPIKVSRKHLVAMNHESKVLRGWSRKGEYDFFLNRYEEPVEIYIYIKTIHLYSIII